jgi:hypothetical protein
VIRLAVQLLEGLAGAPGRPTATTLSAVVAPRCPPGRGRHRASACRASAFPAIAYSAGGWKSAGRPPAAMAHVPPRAIMDDAAVVAGRLKLPPVKRPNGSKTTFKPPAEYVSFRQCALLGAGRTFERRVCRAAKAREVGAPWSKFFGNPGDRRPNDTPGRNLSRLKRPATEEGRDT